MLDRITGDPRDLAEFLALGEPDGEVVLRERKMGRGLDEGLEAVGGLSSRFYLGRREWRRDLGVALVGHRDEGEADQQLGDEHARAYQRGLRSRKLPNRL